MIRTPSRTSSAPKRTKTTTKPKRKSSVVRVPYGISNGPFPFQYQATLRYSELIPISVSTGTIGSYVFSANSLFDPDVTGTGIQPLYFDQLMALYDHYVVLSSTFKCTFASCVGPLGSSNPGLMTVMVDDDGSFTPSSANRTRPTAVSQVVSNNYPKTAFTSWNATKYFGPNPTANNSLQGTAAASPSEQSNYVITAQNFITGDHQYWFFVEMTFTAMFQELKSITAS